MMLVTFRCGCRQRVRLEMTSDIATPSSPACPLCAAPMIRAGHVRLRSGDEQRAIEDFEASG